MVQKRISCLLFSMLCTQLHPFQRVHSFSMVNRQQPQLQIIGDQRDVESSRRACLLNGIALVSGACLLPLSAFAVEENSVLPPPKFIQEYPDFVTSKEGWSYKIVTPGKGDVKAAFGDRVVFEWSGYTIGYYGRPFQAKGGPQGGAFDKELDYERTVIGSGKMVKGLECALVGTSPGQILQIVVPYDEKQLSYPEDDLDHVRVGPKPSTFSGQRALNFVLQNPRVDRTLLFNVKVVRIDKPNASGGFSRG
jgi:FKBP-type peptidyl-prolyl cis-trans isomerase